MILKTVLAVYLRGVCDPSSRPIAPIRPAGDLKWALFARVFEAHLCERTHAPARDRARGQNIVSVANDPRQNRPGKKCDGDPAVTVTNRGLA